jgi:NAD(P)-dependent dehydrogenase (short-subunit alcohol dehydrogenase family)
MTGKLTGKVAVVTGGTANIGKLFAEALAEDGANVVVNYNSPRRSAEADTVVKELTGRGVEAIAHQGDLTAPGQITALVDATIERFGRWDILVNTAGIIVRKPLAETSEQEYDASFAINAKIPFFLMAEASRRMADETISWLKSMTISGDLGDPRDIVPVMRFLVAPETRWVTAQTIYCNGGMISPIN